MPSQMNVQLWLENWLVNPDMLAQQFISIALWKILKHRNNVVFNQAKFDPIQIAGEISSFVAEFTDANPPKLRQSQAANAA